VKTPLFLRVCFAWIDFSQQKCHALADWGRGWGCLQGVQKKGPTAEEVQEEEDRMAAAVLPRKKRNLYNSIQKRTAAKKARVQELEQKRARLGQE
jgi:hypothetical protein